MGTAGLSCEQAAIDISREFGHRAESLLCGQAQILESLALGGSLEGVLNKLIEVVEPLAEGMKCSVLLLDLEGKHLHTAAAPSLPAEYCEAIDGSSIGPRAGSCGTAAFLGQPVFVSNIEDDLLWADYRDLAKRFGFQACWSVPILSEGKVLGTFAMYYHCERSPSPYEIKLINFSTHVASVAIRHARTRESLERSNSILHSTIEATTDGILLVDRKGHFVTYNQKFAHIWKIPASVLERGKDEEALAFAVSQLIDPEAFILKVQELYDNPERDSYDVLEFKDGRVIERYSTPQRLSSEICGRVWSFRDVTERHKAEREAESAYKAKAHFLANISHEIRTPLSAILGFSNLMLEENQGPEERASWGQKIQKNGQYLLQVVDQILNLSKAEFGTMDLDITEFSLQKFLDDTMDVFLPKAREKGTSLRCDVDGPIPETIRTDLTKLQQIVNNLVGNAIKFTESGSVILTVIQNGPQLAFKVQDTGIGLTPEQSHHLFTPFAQADASYGRRFGGTGLGLALAKKLANLLGGDVVLVGSELGAGSTFQATVHASLIGNANTNRIEKSRPRDDDLKGMRVLVVDDSLDNQLIVATFLQRAGAQVDVASTGTEAIDKALSLHPNLVLMDVQMPLKDGYETTRELRDKGFQEPIIALTAHAMKDERARIIDAGCNEHLAKPVDRETLVETIRRYRATA